MLKLLQLAILPQSEDGYRQFVPIVGALGHAQAIFSQPKGLPHLIHVTVDARSQADLIGLPEKGKVPCTLQHPIEALLGGVDHGGLVSRPRHDVPHALEVRQLGVLKEGTHMARPDRAISHMVLQRQILDALHRSTEAEHGQEGRQVGRVGGDHNDAKQPQRPGQDPAGDGAWDYISDPQYHGGKSKPQTVTGSQSVLGGLVPRARG